MNARHEIYDFADQCCVGIGEACDRAGISRSTPPRWKGGSQPRAALVNRLRRAILDIASERGTAPAEVKHDPAPAELPANGVFGSLQEIRAAADRIEAAFKFGRE